VSREALKYHHSHCGCIGETNPPFPRLMLFGNDSKSTDMCLWYYFLLERPCYSLEGQLFIQVTIYYFRVL